MIENPDTYRPAKPLIELLRSIRLTGVLEAHVRMTAPWGVELPHPEDTILIYFVTDGRCVVLADDTDPIELSSGDAFLAIRPVRHAFADSRTSTLMALETLIRMGKEFVPSADEQLRIIFRTRISHGGAGAETRIVALRLYVDSRFPNALRSGIPQFAHLRGFAIRNKSFVESMTREIDENGALGFLGQSIATRLGEALLTKCLREVLEGETKDPGVHRALSDPYIARVIGEMHRHPEHDWTIERLSRTAGLSRSAFLDRFDSVMGTTPAQFQAKLRMSRAVDLIESTSLPLSEIALEVGYSSEAAFNRAFHREMGATPGSLRKASDTLRRRKTGRAANES